MRKFMRTRAPEPLRAPPRYTHALDAHDAHAAHATHATHAAHAPVAAHAHLNGHTTPHHANGHANGVNGGARRDDHHSTLSRYWSGSEGSRGALFEDAEFPATWRSVGDKRRAAGVQWLRPHELCARPTFLHEAAATGEGGAGGAGGGGGAGAGSGSEEPGDELADLPYDTDEELATRWSVTVGELGDAHVCCAAGALALTPRLLARVAPPHSFRRRYTGAVRFNFWVFGAWREVVVDDRLPTRAGRALYSRGGLPDDFTLPLLEKAYAKLYGSYGALRAGSTARALQDLSGGIVQAFSLRQPRALTFRVLNSAVPRSTLLLAALAAREPRRGLLPRQPYVVTGLARVRTPAAGAGAEEGEGGALVRVRAVSGRGLYQGAWSPHSAEWRALPAHDQRLLQQRAQAPGDFWMSFADFASTFTSLELVHVGPDDWLRERALHAKRPWRAVLARRRWRTGYNAGGPPSCTETTGTNPQFHVVVGRGAAGAGGAGAGGKCHVVVSVTQQYAPGSRARPHAIGFAVYELPPSAHPRLTHANPTQLRALDVTHECRAREVATFFTLPGGQYLVVPHTRRAHTDAAFLLRVLTDEHTDVWEVNEDNVIVRDISAEFQDDGQLIPAEIRASVVKMLGKREIDEVDAAGLRRALRRVWRWCLPARPSLELCRALVALRDAGMAGRVRARELPALLALLAYWRQAWAAAAGARGARACAPTSAASAYRLRALLWAAGVTASNKVLECLVLRFARGARLSAEAYFVALARLHLAHERYRALDTKMKSNPLSLEEMILMTVYS